MSLTAVMIADALKQAKSHDEHQERTGATLGPLHGIPFTLKDMFNVKGYDSSLGSVNASINLTKVLRHYTRL